MQCWIYGQQNLTRRLDCLDAKQVTAAFEPKYHAELALVDTDKVTRPGINVLSAKHPRH